jgi:hypothetical protein
MSNLLKPTRKAFTGVTVVKGLLALYGVALVTQGVAGITII